MTYLTTVLATALPVQLMTIPATPPADTVHPTVPVGEPTQEFHGQHLLNEDVQVPFHTDFKKLAKIVDI